MAAGGSGPTPGPTYDRADGKVAARGNGIRGSGCGNGCERYDLRVVAGGIGMGGSGGRLEGACATSGIAGSAEMGFPSAIARAPRCGLVAAVISTSATTWVTCRPDERSGCVQIHLGANQKKAGPSAGDDRLTTRLATGFSAGHPGGGQAHTANGLDSSLPLPERRLGTEFAKGGRTDSNSRPSGGLSH